MIKLLSVIFLHLAALLVMDVGSSSKPGLISTDQIPGYEVCAGDAQAGFDRDCMHRNSDRIRAHVRVTPPAVMEPAASPVVKSILTLFFAFAAWSLALRMKSRAPIFLVSGTYAIAAMSGIIQAMELLVIVVAGTVALGIHLSNCRKESSLRANS